MLGSKRRTRLDKCSIVLKRSSIVSLLNRYRAFFRFTKQQHEEHKWQETNKNETITTMKLTTPLLLSLIATAVKAEEYSFDFSKANDPIVNAPGQLPTRMLFDDDEPCFFEGAKLVCRYSFVTTGSIGDTKIDFEARCDANSQTKFDFRAAANCGCQARVEVPGQPPKTCPCTVCQAGFGKNPINVDCSMYEDQQDDQSTTAPEVTDSIKVIPEVSDSVKLPDDTTAATQPPQVSPYVVNTCTSLDCSAACNGTCALNCANSEEACIFCANNIANQPTGAPTGQTGSWDAWKPSDDPSKQSSSAFISLRVFVAVLAGFCLSWL